MNAQALNQEQTETMEPEEDDFIELSDNELRERVDANAREYLGISGEEVLQRLRERKPLTDDAGTVLPAWGPVTRLARLLLDD